MADFDTINQLIEMKKQISYLSSEIKSLHVSFWEKSMPTIVGALVGGGITLAVNLLNNRKDNKKYENALVKEKNDLVRKLFSEGSGTLMLLTNTILSLNQHNLLRHYYLKKLQIINEFQQQNLETYNREEGYYLQNDTKVRDLLGKISEIITEYTYMVPESNTLENLKKFMEKDPLRVKKEKVDIDKDFEAIQIDLKELLNDARDEIEIDINEYLTPILEEMKDYPNKIKKQIE